MGINLAQQLGKQKQKNYSTRHAGIRLAQRPKIQEETSDRSELNRKQAKTDYSRTVTGREREKKKRTIGFALEDGRA